MSYPQWTNFCGCFIATSWQSCTIISHYFYWRLVKSRQGHPVTASAESVITIDCDFPYNVTSSSENGFDPSRMIVGQGKFGFRIIIDGEKAYISGNGGTEPLTVINGASAKTFAEVTGSGNIMITTITANGDAVHSRNAVFSGRGLLPSQYYGRCTTK